MIRLLWLLTAAALLAALAGLLWLTTQSAEISPLLVALPLALALAGFYHAAPRLSAFAAALALLAGAGLIVAVLLAGAPVGILVPFLTLAALLWQHSLGQTIGRWHPVPRLIHPERMVRSHLLALVAVTTVSLPLWLFATGAYLTLTLWPVIGLALIFLYTLIQVVRYLARSAPPPE